MYFKAIAIGAALIAPPILANEVEPMELHYSRAPDGYSKAQFKPQRQPNPALVVTHVQYPNREALQAAAKDAGATNPETLQAFSASTSSGSRCVIHTVDQTKTYQPEQVGHELLHCLYGSWHDENYQPVLTRRSR